MVVIFDTESNGAASNRICQLSCIFIANDSENTIRAANWFFTVDEINKHAFDIHGFSKNFLREASAGRTFHDVCGDVQEALPVSALYVGHNVSSDIAMLRREFSLENIAFRPKNSVCTMHHFLPCVNALDKRGRQKAPKLTEVCAHYDITDQRIAKECETLFGTGGLTWHDARFDAAATYLCVVEAQITGDLRGVLKCL